MARDPRLTYSFAGVLFGCCFPIISTSADLLFQGLSWSASNLILVHATQPLHWIIDTAPLFLGLFAYVAGERQFSVLELNQSLERKVEMRTEQLQEQNRALQLTQDELKDSLLKISQSIDYAERIQHAFLRDVEHLKNDLPGSFVYYRPKDVVSGDFPWYLQHNGYTYIAAVDCTGHGVPGAMMSIIGNFLLHRVVNELGISDTGAILDELHCQVRDTLDQNDIKDVQDGMDLSIARVDSRKGTVQCSGAGNPLYHVSNGDLNEYRGDVYSIGGYYRKAVPEFKQTEFSYNNGDVLYLFSDGIPDQIGCKNKIKFGYSRIKELITQNGTITAESGLSKHMSKWMGTCPQIDDMLVMGIQL